MIKNQREKGIALMLVLGAIVVLTAMTVEFAYNTNVNYHLARNELDRLKAAYLAKSAYNFMKIELKFDRLFRHIVSSQNLGQFLGANANLPLCQQYPISTSLVRAVFLGGEGGENLPSALKTMVSMSDESNAEEFLAFDGDFDGTCTDESTKINLNMFFNLSPLQRVEEGYNAYDKAKLALMSFFGVETYRELFEISDVKVADVVRNIADWVDTNPSMNEMGGGESGPESVIYDKLNPGLRRAGKSYPIRNSKMITLEEAFLIDGVTDDWFGPLEKYFTVYGDSLVNVCGAEDAIVQNLIRRYVEGNPTLPPVAINEPETMDKLVSAVHEGCNSGSIGAQLKQQIATSLDAALGAVGGQAPASGGQAQTPPTQGSPTQGQGAAQSASSSFASLINTEPRFFSLLLTGSVNDIVVKIKAVLDVADPDPKRWKLLYWRVY